jgi:hypothetical protein
MTALELSGAPEGLLDDPPALRLRGSGGADGLVWRGRIRDDDGRVWRAIADRQEALMGAWVPAKSSTSMLMALGSRRPVELEVRAEAPDGRAATRTLRRLLVADGVRVRRWRDATPAVLHLPAPGGASLAALLLDATAAEGDAAAVATLAAPLLASRGVIALVVAPVARADGAELVERALAALAQVPAVVESGTPPRMLRVLASQQHGHDHAAGTVVVTPPGVGVRGAGAGPEAAAARAHAWDALLAAVGATPRQV